MVNKTTTNDVAVIVGRFQVHQLHEAHIELIDTVQEMHSRVIIFIGLSPLRNTKTNPLDFPSRKKMIQEAYPDVEVYYIDDNRSDVVWSKNLDRQIENWLKPGQSATLYGSRDSFIPYYHGKFSTAELESKTYVSGTEIRRRISVNHPPTKDFRAGVISASHSRYPTCYATVDVAVIDKDRGRLLLGQKAGETNLRFLGGFSSPESESYEEDGRREVMEEAGIVPEEMTYIGSTTIDDWRYRGEADRIKTLFFVGQYMSGRPQGGDDIASVTWVSLEDAITGKIAVVEEHQVLMDMLIAYLKKVSSTNTI